MANFIVEFSPQIVSPKQGYAEYTHREEWSSIGILAETESAPEDLEVHKEPPWGIE